MFRPIQLRTTATNSEQGRGSSPLVGSLIM
jgi:hypothetical protein